MTEAEKKIITMAKEKAFKYLVDCHQQYGHFPILEFYPDFEPKKSKGWHFTYPSIFIHANVMYSLLEINDKRFSYLLNKSRDFLLSKMEKGGIWRFWDIDNCQHPVPCGIDETAIASLVLNKLGVQIDNKKLLNEFWNTDGSVKTWIYSLNSLLFKFPFVYFYLKNTDKSVKSTINQNMLALEDSEPTITANFLVYLGKDTLNKNSIEYISYHWDNFQSEKYSFYNNKLVYAFYISRAYKEGELDLKSLSNKILVFIKTNLNHFSFSELLMSILIYNYLALNGDDFIELAKKRLIEKIDFSDSIFENFPIITSKDRAYYGGSGALTAAWFLEVASYWESEDKE